MTQVRRAAFDERHLAARGFAIAGRIAAEKLQRDRSINRFRDA
jgi:hypothetical protein